MKIVKFLKDQGQFKKGKSYTVTTRHSEILVRDKIAELIEKENKEAKGRQTK